MTFIDTHCHLFLKEFETDSDDVIKRSIHSEVTKMIVPNVDSSTILPLVDLCKKYSNNLFPAIGMHPCSVKENVESELQKHKQYLEHNKFIAIGEIGIDLYWDKTFFKEQIIALETQIEWALEYKLPVILHCRESFEEVYNIVRKYKNLRGVFHAFTGTHEDAIKIIELGFYVGIGGVVTFKNSNLGKEILGLPLENIILETDSPYLTPAPYRGKRNEPSYIPIIAQKLSEIYNISLKEIEATTTENATNLFGIL